MTTFSVKNFERFQHYKDRSPPWIKLYNELLDDYAFGLLRDASKMHLVAIWLLASRSDNEIPYDPAWIAKRINATEVVDLDILSDAGFIVVNQSRSKTLAKRKQVAMPETEKEGETEERQKETRAVRTLLVADFDVWWEVFPEKQAKGQARRAFPAALKKAGSLVALLEGTRRYIAAKPVDRQFCYPATFLNGERWADQPATASQANGHPDPDAERKTRARAISKGMHIPSISDHEVGRMVAAGYLTSEQAVAAGYDP